MDQEEIQALVLFCEQYEIERSYYPNNQYVTPVFRRLEAAVYVLAKQRLEVENQRKAGDAQ